jgi:hypothetical protein
MFEVEQRIKDAFAQGRAAMWDAAKAMHEFDQENGWTALGYEKLGDWLADPGIQMTRATYYRWVGTYRKLLQRKVDESELRELDVSKVDIVLGAVEAGRVELDDALADVKELGARDLRDRYIQRPDPAKAVPPVEDDDPPNVETDDEVPYDPPPVNTGDDAPVKASEAEPAQNTDDGASGQDQPDEVEEVDAEPVNQIGRASCGSPGHGLPDRASRQGRRRGEDRDFNRSAVDGGPQRPGEACVGPAIPVSARPAARSTRTRSCTCLRSRSG